MTRSAAAWGGHHPIRWDRQEQIGQGWSAFVFHVHNYQELTLPGKSGCGLAARVIQFDHCPLINCGEVIAMLAEKFLLVLETLRSHADDRPTAVNSAVRHIPIKLTPAK